MTVNGSSDDIEAHKEVNILKATLLKCLACNLCGSLLRDATTISECLHSFCSDCITAKLSDGETETCPVCEVHLGPLPLEKLRPDHHLDVLTEKLFSKKRKLVATSNGNSTRRKERLLSSLGAQGPPALNPGYASRQTRALSSSDDDDEADISDDDDDSPTTTSQKREDYFRPEEAKVYPQSEPRRRAEDTPEVHMRGLPWTTSKLMQQTVVSNGNKNVPLPGARIVRGSRKSNGSARPAAADFPSALDALAQVANAEEETGSGPASPSPPLDLLRMTKAAAIDTTTPNSQLSLQSRLKQTLNGVMDRSSILRTPRPVQGGQSSRLSSANGIWFHLESGDVQANEDALPPLASPYVRIKDGKLPVYHVKTYLVQKLSHKVKTEMEVEITCRGQPVVSSLPLESIRDIWFSAQISDQPQPAQVPGEASGAPANGRAAADFPTSKDFLMVLTYRRHRKPRIN